ncbi:MAG TPA: hypothetical protein PK951_10970 [Chitinophagaceae bacterium]|nr:hypothetical protein [Chitinophagaceae bacterium]
MRRFLITSAAFTGEVEAVYDGSARLIRFDVSKTNMPPDLINRFKSRVPAHIDEMAVAWAGTKAVVVEADFEVSLEDFKREYPYSRNYHLLDARWKKLSKTEQVEAYYGAIDYRKYCTRNDWYMPKIADSWLANKEFKNDWKKM